MQRRWLSALAALVFAGPVAGCGYNTIQTLDVQADKAKSGIEVQLQRRADLVPNLVSTVKGYAQHEEAVFTQVAQARAGLAGAVQTHDVAKMADANQQLSQGLGRLLAISENYPQLKADQGFLRLQDELTGTENRIAVARKDYNEAAGEYNGYIRRFPQKLTASMTGAKAKDFFQVTTPGANAVPTVDFSKPK
ncbi:MAG: LemA family protein [Gemmatimonadaceae bacterium]